MTMAELFDWARVILYLLTALAITLAAADHIRPIVRAFHFAAALYMVGLAILLVARNDVLPFTRDAWTNYVMTPALLVMCLLAWGSIVLRKRL